MIDLSIITAIVARDRVAEQFAGPAVTDATAPAATAPVRRAAVSGLQALADRVSKLPSLLRRLDEAAH